MGLPSSVPEGSDRPVAPVSYARLSACIEKVDYLEGLVEEYQQKIAFLEEEVKNLRALVHEVPG